jgi:hypothetical protein
MSDYTIRIVNVERSFDQISYQPYVRLTLDLPLSVQDDSRTEEENALVFYRAFTKAALAVEIEFFKKISNL